MKDKDYPDYIDEINKIYENLWSNILDGSKNNLSDYHTFSLATCSKNQVSNRTVVLRDCNEKDRTMSFHTNNLSKKINDINLNPNVECLFYSKINNTQIRVSGIAEIFTMNNMIADYSSLYDSILVFYMYFIFSKHSSYYTDSWISWMG